MLNQQTKFDIGNVVEWTLNIWTHGVKGIIVKTKCLDSRNTFLYSFYRFHNVINNGEQYPTDYQIRTITSEFLKICQDSCNDCKYNEMCHQMRDIVTCGNSEFGQLRGEGKYNPDICELRKCNHLLACGVTKFIQN